MLDKDLDISILNEDFIRVSAIGIYTSFIWTDRYMECGDFELVAPANADFLKELELDKYVSIIGSDRLMIIEEITTLSDVDAGSYTTIVGRSLESILSRRVITAYTKLSGNFQTAIQTLLNQNIISPGDSKRKIENFIFTPSADEAITSLTIGEIEYLGENLYDVIVELCKEKGVGFKIVVDDSDRFSFSLFKGVDHSFDQEDRGIVIFSPKYENLSSSNYYRSKKDLKTSVAVINKDSENMSASTITIVNSETEEGGSGLNRREFSMDSSEDDPTTAGKVELSSDDYKDKELFEGEISANSNQFEFHRDFEIGDIVEIENEYGRKGKVRVDEVVTSSDSGNGGFAQYPTFTTIN